MHMGFWWENLKERGCLEDRVEDNITVGGCGSDSSGSRYGPIVDSLVNCNETWVP